HRVWRALNHLTNRLWLPFSRRHAHQTVRHNAALNNYLRGKNMIGWNLKMLHRRFDYPIACRRDRPNIASRLMQMMDKFFEFRKNIPDNIGIKILILSAYHFVLG